MVKIDFLNLSEFLHQKYHVTFKIKGKRQVALLDEFDFARLESFNWMIQKVALNETKKFVFFLHLLVFIENSVKQSGLIYDNDCSVSKTEVY